eukprot:663158_1
MPTPSFYSINASHFPPQQRGTVRHPSLRTRPPTRPVGAPRQPTGPRPSDRANRDGSGDRRGRPTERCRPGECRERTVTEVETGAVGQQSDADQENAESEGPGDRVGACFRTLAASPPGLRRAH